MAKVLLTSIGMGIFGGMVFSICTKLFGNNYCGCGAGALIGTAGAFVAIKLTTEKK